MPAATLAGTKAQASVPLLASVICVGSLRSAWIMPSFEAKTTSGLRPALALMKLSARARSVGVP
jgi:hypothetical protein